MRVTILIAIALLFFSCKKEDVFDSPGEEESVKLVNANITSWEGTDTPLCEGGHPECGADYYLNFLVPHSDIEIKHIYVDNNEFFPEVHVVKGQANDTLKFQMHYYEHSSCKLEHPEFLLRDVDSQEIKLEYEVHHTDVYTYSQVVPVSHVKF